MVSSARSRPFLCSVCNGDEIARTETRGDGRAVVFCSTCGMGVVAHAPSETEQYYADGYYARTPEVPHGYSDYEFTAEHSLLWLVIMLEMLFPTGGALLDIGCATGWLSRRLGSQWSKYGIEVNRNAASKAVEAGTDIIGDDLLDRGLVSLYSGRFNVITAIATYEHVLDIKSAVASSLEMLDPRGAIIFELPLVSDSRDSPGWFDSSYEHIFYPTIRGISALFAGFPDVRCSGFETDIAGFSSTYIGVATRDPERLHEVERMFSVMRNADPSNLPLNDKVLNLAYTVVHDFRPSPARISQLPALLERYCSLPLLTRLTQLWYSDALRAQATDRSQPAPK